MSKNSGGFLSRGGIWVLAQFALMILVIVTGTAFQGRLIGVPGLILGAALFIAGAWFGIAGAIDLGRNRTPYPRPLGTSSLIQHGIYARVRHPLYTSVMLLSVAWALFWQSGPSLVASLALVPFFYGKARREERWLLEKFPDYAEYARRVPRFFPRLRAAPKIGL